MLKRFIWIPIVLISGCAQQDLTGVEQELTALKETVESLKVSLARQDSLRDRIILLESRVEAVDDNLAELSSWTLEHRDWGKHRFLTTQELHVQDSAGKPLISAGANTDGYGLLTVANKEGKDMIYAGANTDGDGLLKVKNKEGKDLIYAGVTESGGFLNIENITGEDVVELRTDDYGHGYIGVWDRKGKGRTLQPGQ
jgi:hypothetical protein